MYASKFDIIPKGYLSFYFIFSISILKQNSRTVFNLNLLSFANSFFAFPAANLHCATRAEVFSENPK